MLLFAVLSRGQLKIRVHLSGRLSWNVFGSLLEGLWVALGVPRGRPEGLLTVHWGLLGVSWGVLGVSWVAFASPGGCLGGSKGSPASLLGRRSAEAVPT